MTQHILVINCGSSSIKFALVETETGQAMISGLAERLNDSEAALSWRLGGEKSTRAIGEPGHEAAMNQIINLLASLNLLDEQLVAVGHRVVHGGEAFTQSTLIDTAVLEGIRAVSHLAPLHNPANILGIETAVKLLPHLPQAAVFDTSFHQTMPPHAYMYGLPYDLYTDYGVRRYGFHGTSHRYVTQQAAQVLGKPYEQCALLSAHLGNGSSATAVLNGQSVDSTMGLTPLEGLVMGTRSGDVDPGLHGFLAQQLNLSIDEITALLNKKSGLLGLSGLSNDMRTLLEAADNGNERAQLAINVFCYRLAKALAALAVPLGRIDALIFTGGIGENAAPIRAQTVAHLSLLGFAIDDERNEENGRFTSGLITPDSSTPAYVIPTNEEAMIAQDTLALISH